MNETASETAGHVRPGRDKTHWKEWEIGCLVGAILEDRDLDAIGPALGRSPAACRRMAERLRKGEAEYPESVKQRLPAFVPATPPSVERALTDRAVEQFKVVVQELRRIGASLERGTQVTHAVLAMCLDRKLISLEQLTTVLGPKATAVIEMRRKILMEACEPAATEAPSDGGGGSEGESNR